MLRKKAGCYVHVRQQVLCQLEYLSSLEDLGISEELNGLSLDGSDDPVKPIVGNGYAKWHFFHQTKLQLGSPAARPLLTRCSPAAHPLLTHCSPTAHPLCLYYRWEKT